MRPRRDEPSSGRAIGVRAWTERLGGSGARLGGRGGASSSFLLLPSDWDRGFAAAAVLQAWGGCGGQAVGQAAFRSLQVDRQVQGNLPRETSLGPLHAEIGSRARGR